MMFFCDTEALLTHAVLDAVATGKFNLNNFRADVVVLLLPPTDDEEAVFNPPVAAVPHPAAADDPKVNLSGLLPGRLAIDPDEVPSPRPLLAADLEQLLLTSDSLPLFPFTFRPGFVCCCPVAPTMEEDMREDAAPAKEPRPLPVPMSG